MFLGDWTGNLASLFDTKEAIYDVRTQERVSYAQLARRVDRMARALAHLGVQKGDRVAILAKNRLEHFDLLFATARLGALYVPLNWRLAEPELAFLLDDLEARLLFHDKSFAYVAGRLCATRTTVAVAFDGENDDEQAPIERRLDEVFGACDERVSPRQAEVGLEDPWIVLYTSGTTGRPKGALLPYRQVAFNALNTLVALDLTSTDRTITYTPMFHTGALHVLSTPLLSTGGSFVLTDGFDPAECLQLAQDEKCTILFGVPTTFEMMAEQPAFHEVNLESVRVAICGGAPCPVSLIERYRDRGILFKQGYGLTEVGPNCLNLREADVARKLGFAGRPNLHLMAKIVDDEGRTIEGAGRGELCLGGPCACLGYWRRPEANAAAFTEDGYFKTGDVVERDDEGFYKIVDRAKDMFISGGENVYPAEVEKALADHPAVRACAVVGIPDEKWGEVGRAYFEVYGAPVGGDVLKVFLKERLAGYKVPKQYVVLPELPRNPSGKVQKHLLPREPIADVLAELAGTFPAAKTDKGQASSALVPAN